MTDHVKIVSSIKEPLPPSLRDDDDVVRYSQAAVGHRRHLQWRMT